MTISEVLNAYSGFFDKENKRTELQWETTRWLGWIEWNLHVTKKHRINDPKRLIKFEWDKKESKEINWDEINKRFPDKLRNGNK